MCLTLILEERIRRTGELLFSTPITPSEYLVSTWIVGFAIACLVCYSGIIIFTLINGFGLVSGLPGTLWLAPLIMALTWASAGVLLGVTLVLSSYLKKIMLWIISLVPALALFAITLHAPLKMKQGAHYVPPDVTLWLVAGLYLSVLLFPLSRTFQVRGLVR